MENTVFFAILSAIAAGSQHFMFKVIAERHYDPSLINGLAYIPGIILMGFYLLYQLGTGIVFQTQELVVVGILGFLNALLFNISIVTRLISLRNIDTVIFYPLYKTFGPLVVTAISLIIFSESLTQKEIGGIVIVITIPLLLITKIENRIQKNLFIGVIFMLVATISSALSASTAKATVSQNYSIELFIFLAFLSGSIIFLINYKLFSRNSSKKYVTKGVNKFCCILGMFQIASFVFFAQALKGNFAVAYTINSFSILIPIILSIIFYGEHFNFKKGIVIVLSIISILLFI